MCTPTCLRRRALRRNSDNEYDSSYATVCTRFGLGGRRGPLLCEMLLPPHKLTRSTATATAACAWHQHPHGMNEPLQQCFDCVRQKCSREKDLCDRADTFAAKLGHNYVRLNNKTVHVR